MGACPPMAAAILVMLRSSPSYSLRVFTPSDFAIKRQIGQLGFATETEWQYYGGSRNPLNPDTPARTVQASGASVRLFDADLFGRRVLLKEYLGDANEIGENELAVYRHLYSQTEDTGGGTPSQVSTMVGHMRSDEAFDSAEFVALWAQSLPRVTPPTSGNLWTVFAWEGLLTVAGFPRAAQQRALWDFNGRGALAERRRFLKAIAKQSVSSVAWLHGRGILHRSLGGSSLLLNTHDQSLSKQLGLKVTDLGFAAIASALPEEEVAKAMRLGASSPLSVFPLLALNDLHQLGYLLLELIISSLATPASEGQPARVVELQALKRLIEDVFEDDLKGGFRDYCVEEPEWSEAVALLDEADRAGWALLQQLVDCHLPHAVSRVSAINLIESEWFVDA